MYRLGDYILGYRNFYPDKIAQSLNIYFSVRVSLQSEALNVFRTIPQLNSQNDFG